MNLGGTTSSFVPCVWVGVYFFAPAECSHRLSSRRRLTKPDARTNSNFLQPPARHETPQRLRRAASHASHNGGRPLFTAIGAMKSSRPTSLPYFKGGAVEDGGGIKIANRCFVPKPKYFKLSSTSRSARNRTLRSAQARFHASPHL